MTSKGSDRHPKTSTTGTEASRPPSAFRKFAVRFRREEAEPAPLVFEPPGWFKEYAAREAARVGEECQRWPNPATPGPPMPDALVESLIGRRREAKDEDEED